MKIQLFKDLLIYAINFTIVSQKIQQVLAQILQIFKESVNKVCEYKTGKKIGNNLPGTKQGLEMS